MSTTRRSAPYFQAPHSGPACSTAVSQRLRERRLAMGREKREEPEEYRRLAEDAVAVLTRHETTHPALGRARAMSVVVENCPISLEKDALLIGGEDPFLFDLMLPALWADRYQGALAEMPDDEQSAALRERGVILFAPCFEGHITPGLESILGQGTSGLRNRLRESEAGVAGEDAEAVQKRLWYEAALLSCDNIERYAARLRERAEQLLGETGDPEWAEQLRGAVQSLAQVPRHPARTLHEALQAYWVVYILVTIEMGGCVPGGGLGLGRPDQYLLPHYRADLSAGRLAEEQALELLEVFLLNFQHVDYYTGHQIYTPGSQASIGGVTPTGLDASNELTELIMEASLRIHMPAPYISLRFHGGAPERYWRAAASYVVGGLGFSIVNDDVLIPAFLKHGRSLADARDYICSCCYELTIPGREAFHPNGCYINLPFVLELALNEGRSLLTGERLGEATPPPESVGSFHELVELFCEQLRCVLQSAVAFVNRADRLRMQMRHMPMMSLFIEPCIERGTDVAAGGARYNLTGMIVGGLPNVVNALAAIRGCVFVERAWTLDQVRQALRDDFSGRDPLHQQLLQAPKWGNGDEATDRIARDVSDRLYAEMRTARNARGGRWQLAFYSFLANHHLGRVVGASADGRRAGTPLTRNLNPSWGTDRRGPTAVLTSLASIDFTQFPNGGTLDLRFDPEPFLSETGRETFVAFLKTFVSLGVMQMQITMVDTDVLLEARAHPERWPDLMVKVAGYSARFVDLPEEEKDEIIGRSVQRLGDAG